MKNYSRSYTISQEGIKSGVVVALDGSGKSTFIAKETTTGKPRKLKRHKPWTKHKIATNCNLVLKDIVRLIQYEFQGPCDTDDGALLFEQALPFLVARHIAYNRSEDTVNSYEWAWTHCRRLAVDNPRSWFEEAEQVILRGFANFDGRPSIPDRDAVSKALHLTEERRVSAKLLHLPAIERPPCVRERDRKAYDRARKAAARAKAGAKPHEASREKRRPWTAYGMSRSTYYRAKADGRLIEFEHPVKAGNTPTTSDPIRTPVLALVSG